MGITIVGLGPGDAKLLTRQAWQVLHSAELLYLRTSHHPAVDALPMTWHGFDHLYNEADSFESVYTEIVETLLAIGRERDVVYAVPGHPFVAESTVTALVAAAEEANVSCAIIEGLSFVEPTLTALKADALDGLQLLDALGLNQSLYPPVNADCPVLIGQLYSQLVASEAKLNLSGVYGDEHTVALVHAVGSAKSKVEWLPLYAIDRSPHIGHMTSLYVPARAGIGSLAGFAETIAVLRSPEGCPWDQQQTAQSMRTGFLEEVAEALDALDGGDVDNLAEELGDVLLHLVFQAQIGAEQGAFTLTDIIAGIDEKIKRRHPHVWGTSEVADADAVELSWAQIKAREKGGKAAQSVLDNVPQALPALARSQKIQKRVRKVGFDWPDITGVWDKLEEEIGELRAAENEAERRDELGDLLFVTVNLAKWLGVDAEIALREANLKFERRFRAVEQLMDEQNLSFDAISIDLLERLWQDAKGRVG